MDLLIGQHIKGKLKERNMSVKLFADKLGIRRTNVYRDLFEQASLDTGLLMKISEILQYDFFADLSKKHQERSQQ